MHLILLMTKFCFIISWSNMVLGGIVNDAIKSYFTNRKQFIRCEGIMSTQLQ